MLKNECRELLRDKEIQYTKREKKLPSSSGLHVNTKVTVVSSIFGWLSEILDTSHCCSSQDDGATFPVFILMLNCFNVASSAVWFPEKYAETAL